MLTRTADTAMAGDPAEGMAALPVAACAAALVARLGTGNLIFIAADGQRAAWIAAIAAAYAPAAAVIHLPSSDALPGDDAPPSAANVGQRVAALRGLYLAGDEPILLVTSAEATLARYAPPAAFDTAPPAVRVGDAIDLVALAAAATALGYVADDRVDEPGEIAVRGGVIDIFPADQACPVRIDVVDGAVAAIRHYDPVTQLGDTAIDVIEIGRASEPEIGKGVALTSHVAGATVILDRGAAERRDRLVEMVAVETKAVRTVIVDGPAWAKAAGTTEALDLVDVPPPPRFVEERDPARAFARFARKVLADGRLTIVGSARDLRFLAARATIACRSVATLAEAVAASPGDITMLVAPIDRGFVIGDLTIVAAADLLGTHAAIDEAAASRSTNAFDAAGALQPGDAVVHEDHGIGVVRGLEPSPTGDGEVIVLDYAKQARRLVSVADADRIWRYGADADGVSLDTLDGGSWQKRRGAIDTAIAESARALSAIATERDGRSTAPIVPDAARYERFAAGFPFTETPDQAHAIAAVRADLASGRPMDRLVVGDVGYGKTEVALRATALVAMAGRQVAIVAPTTVLARQHADTFGARLAGTGCTVALLTRFTTAAERKRIVAGVADGSIAVVVGTAAVAGKGIGYRDLALVVIDEEQRFGAADKAKLRALGAGHVLTLTATPIPRTLQSALVGLQSISTIASPPAQRQPIRTAIATLDDDAVRIALRRERSRGGQSFVVVPRIADIAPFAERLARIVPELGIVIAHGKLAAEALDEAMIGFAAGDGDVLLATNIVEAGLDVPRANTMIVHRADRFGLSQLHQLRGRVGRGGRRGQILLLTDPGIALADSTLKRLRTLQAFDRLGAGFAISARDLDLRGAGDLVGEEQAGHMKLIGVDLYQHLFAHALARARGQAEDRWSPELHLEIEGRLPEDWIPEADLRLALYGRLARLDRPSAIDGFEAELEDRFGAIPAAASDLLAIARIGAVAASAGIIRIDAGPAAIAFTPKPPAKAPPTPFEPADGRWIVRERTPVDGARLARILDLLDDI